MFFSPVGPTPRPEASSSGRLRLASIRIAIALALGFAGLCLQAQETATPPAGGAEGVDNYSFLGQVLDLKISGMDWGGGRVTASVEDADLPIKAYSLRPGDMMRPGSLVQLLTASAALEKLGAGARFPTELRVSGTIDENNGTLNGSIIARGGGDPTLSLNYLHGEKELWATFDAWARLLRKRGIRRVTGRVIGDGSLFNDQLTAPGWPIDQMGSGRLPSISALNFNHNCYRVKWLKGRKVGQAARYEVFPWFEKFSYFTSTVKWVQVEKMPRRYARVPQGNLISASGDLQINAEVTDEAAILDPARFYAEALRSRLIKAGIQVEGEARSLGELKADEVSTETNSLDVVFSRPAHEILRHMLHDDSALEAEVFLKKLGGRWVDAREPGGFGNGASALIGLMDELRLPGNLRVIVDGSGRSTLNQLSAEQLTALLRAMFKHGAGAAPANAGDASAAVPQRLIDLLPRPGEGHLADRLTERFIARDDVGTSTTLTEADLIARQPDKKRAKAGEPPPIWALASQEEGVAALAGYLRTDYGRTLAFAILVNDSKLPARVLRNNLDDLVLEMSR